ncbi:hypothetical protein [Salinimicrobium marinum]|uniref:hypothetical protein n=1 Tax=Salinimicrobium marinum TaxID=680283 RepID=UPI00167384E6|nr:hypothetical protein [Salinimicrobium marinum]
MNSFLVTVAVKLLLVATGENPQSHFEKQETNLQKASVEMIDTLTNEPDSLEFSIRHKD